ncbi:hypothetical protein QBC46DRAFT_95846 [Diplogelasinospora grovesii]|uniref:Uncharacterized protein n=1 Tax=Diplogelasinospora grovesii TaxID=303347 RepID=A0AAN6NHK2_9PEZI|nr:hypothetical protein QBC46DRAFT_95846 [Diplogelasinospora grovesii]
MMSDTVCTHYPAGKLDVLHRGMGGWCVCVCWISRFPQLPWSFHGFFSPRQACLEAYHGRCGCLLMIVCPLADPNALLFSFDAQRGVETSSGKRTDDHHMTTYRKGCVFSSGDENIEERSKPVMQGTHVHAMCVCVCECVCIDPNPMTCQHATIDRSLALLRLSPFTEANRRNPGSNPQHTDQATIETPNKQIAGQEKGAAATSTGFAKDSDQHTDIGEH